MGEGLSMVVEMILMSTWMKEAIAPHTWMCQEKDL